MAKGRTEAQHEPLRRIKGWASQNPYRIYERPAGNIKARVQMMLGIGLLAFLFVRLCYPAITALGFRGPLLTSIGEWEPLAIVSRGLMYSAGVELAYMLFTDGPDEAVHPVLLGLASAILLILSDDAFDWRDAIIVPVLCLSMAVLFWIDATYLKKPVADDAETEQPLAGDGCPN